MPAIGKGDDSKKDSKKKLSEKAALAKALAEMKEEVNGKTSKKSTKKASKVSSEPVEDGPFVLKGKPTKGRVKVELTNSTEDDANPIKPGDKVLNRSVKYKIVLDKKTKEADLHFSLENPIEDRYFAYCITLMDLFHTMESVKKAAPPSVIAEFETALHVLKGMSESIKRKIEEDAGLRKPMLEGKKKEDIKRMIETIKDKIEKKFPGSKVKFTKVGSESELPDVIKSIVEEIEKEIRGKKGKGKDKKGAKLENEDIEPRTPSRDLEL